MLNGNFLVMNHRNNFFFLFNGPSLAIIIYLNNRLFKQDTDVGKTSKFCF